MTVNELLNSMTKEFRRSLCDVLSMIMILMKLTLVR